MTTENQPDDALSQAVNDQLRETPPAEASAPAETNPTPQDPAPDQEKEPAPEPNGDATTETESEAEPAQKEPAQEAAPEYDYSGKIKLSAADFDAIDKDEAISLVANADIASGYKAQILEQIKGGSLSYQFAEAIRRMQSAKASGGIYRGGQDGL